MSSNCSLEIGTSMMWGYLLFLFHAIVILMEFEIENKQFQQHLMVVGWCESDHTSFFLQANRYWHWIYMYGSVFICSPQRAMSARRCLCLHHRGALLVYLRASYDQQCPELPVCIRKGHMLQMQRIMFDILMRWGQDQMVAFLDEIFKFVSLSDNYCILMKI